MASASAQISSQSASHGFDDYASHISSFSETFARSTTSEAHRGTATQVVGQSHATAQTAEPPRSAHTARVGARSFAGSQSYFDGLALDSGATVSATRSDSGEPVEFDELVGGKHDLLALDYLFSTVDELF
jgi:hypothetical protein